MYQQLKSTVRLNTEIQGIILAIEIHGPLEVLGNKATLLSDDSLCNALLFNVEDNILAPQI